MNNDVVTLERFAEQRNEKRNLADRYYSVQFSIKQRVPIYQFKLKDISSTGLCIIVKDSSKLLQMINIGDIIEMTFCAADAPEDTLRRKTKLAHITPDNSGKYKDHYLVGFSMIDEDTGLTKQE